MVELPASLLALTDREPGWAAWLDRLPRLAADLLRDWDLVPDGAARHGECALVLPVRTADGEPAALKITWPHDEAAHEHLALQHWHGDGAVRLLRADPHRWALLLERLHPEDLTGLDAEEACALVAASYRRLHRPAPPQLTRLSTRAQAWAGRLLALPRDAPVPRRMVEQAAALARGFADDDATDGRLLHTDLHYANVLAGDREPWLVIDPKPLSGDPHYEVAPLLRNRWDEVVASGDVRAAVRRRFGVVVDVAGLDEDRARDWVVVREMVNVLAQLEWAQREGRAWGSVDPEWGTRAVTIAKAVQG